MMGNEMRRRLELAGAVVSGVVATVAVLQAIARRNTALTGDPEDFRRWATEPPFEGKRS